MRLVDIKRVDVDAVYYVDCDKLTRNRINALYDKYTVF